MMPQAKDPHRTTTTAAQVVIYFLGSIAILGMIGTIGLVGIKADPAGIALVSSATGAALGGLTAILSQTNRPVAGSPQPVTVVNDPAQPVPTTDQDPK